tara:strand:+ start:2397 stop:2864 length:468 start_codon:yes stop_codon:yes gene_type:complete
MAAQRRRNQRPPKPTEELTNISTDKWVAFLRNIPEFNQETFETYQNGRRKGESKEERYAEREGIDRDTLKARPGVPGSASFQTILDTALNKRWIRLIEVHGASKPKDYWFREPEGTRMLEQFEAISDLEQRVRGHKEAIFGQNDNDDNNPWNTNN